MILNGKAKEDFINWICKKYPEIRWHEFKSMPKIFVNVLIIEWFDSVGIFVNIDVISENNSLELSDWFYVIKINNEDVDFITNDYYYNSRQKATTEGIKKANEIFNSL